MSNFTINLADATDRSVVGGKGVGLAELSRIDGGRVPGGFAVTTIAYRQVVAPAIDEHLDALNDVDPNDLASIRARSAEVRGRIESLHMPDDLIAAVRGQLDQHDAGTAWAVRSSATAEDLPSASFAGQQDSFLNIRPDDVVTNVRRCWTSLFTDRAVAYRARAGFDHRTVAMAVVVQRMVDAQASGVMFTADPVTGDRTVVAVEAVPGLGEALVAGTVAADAYTVRNGTIADRTISVKQSSLHPAPSGGTEEHTVPADRQHASTLTDEQVLHLVQLGRRVEQHFGRAQDIEWCLDDGGFQFVQSRPITTLFPVPAVDDDQRHVYVSVGHQQMMTEAMRPLGISLWQLTSPAPMREAGSRLFVDVTDGLAAPATQQVILDNFVRSDPLIGDALHIVVDRGDLLPNLPDTGAASPSPTDPPTPLDNDPAVPAALVEGWETANAAAEAELRELAGVELLDAIRADIDQLRQVLFDPGSLRAVMAGMEATWWLNDRLHEWLDEVNAADTLTLAAPNNVTSEMGLALLDVADTIRPHPDVVSALQAIDPDHPADLFAQVAAVEGGTEAVAAIRTFLGTYGMRCVGEIDITRPRWGERPAALVPLLLSNIRNFEAGAARRRVQQGRQDALAREREVLQRLRALPGGDDKAEGAKHMIDRVRTFIGYREYPKYGMVTRYFTYKQALLRVAAQLVDDRVLGAMDDIFYLTFDELGDGVDTGRVDEAVVRRRRDEFRSSQTLTPPRVMTSDGEVITGTYRRDDVPDGALVGFAVSSGTIEGRARVIHDIADADLEPGDILVTACTDPSWTPAFVAISGLVTEVGGSMTHGAVVAREYGLPAVVGVQDATRLVPDGARIRVHGTDGYVELLPG